MFNGFVYLNGNFLFPQYQLYHPKLYLNDPPIPNGMVLETNEVKAQALNNRMFVGSGDGITTVSERVF